jgi:hypothetical protein
MITLFILSLLVMGLANADVVETWRPALHPRSEFIYVIGPGLAIFTCAGVWHWDAPSIFFASWLVSFGGCLVYLQWGYNDHCRLVATDGYRGHESNYIKAYERKTLTQRLLSR